MHFFCRVCSGRQTCSVSVPNTQLEKTSPCFKELITYLKTKHICIKGMKKPDAIPIIWVKYRTKYCGVDQELRISLPQRQLVILWMCHQIYLNPVFLTKLQVSLQDTTFFPKRNATLISGFLWWPWTRISDPGSCPQREMTLGTRSIGKGHLAQISLTYIPPQKKSNFRKVVFLLGKSVPLPYPFYCFTVANAPPTTCRRTGFVKLGLDEGYISSVIGSKTGCGLQKTPWVIQVGKNNRCEKAQAI